MGLLTPDPGLLFWMVITFGVVFFILAKYGFPVILKTVEDRKAYIDNSLKAAREANEQLANVKVEGEKILAQAREEQHRILSEAAATRDRIIKDAQEKAFAEGNRLTGVGACNRLTGAYKTDGKRTLKIGPLAATMMACPGMEQEDAFTKALEATTHYDMDGPMLLLLGDGELKAVFQAKP